MLKTGWLVAVVLTALGGTLIAQAPAPTPAASDLPLVGIAGIAFKVSNLDKARAHYSGVLGYEEAFTLKDASGKVTSAFFKVNDTQFIEVVPILKAGEILRQARVVFQSSNLPRLHQVYTERGLKPTAITTGPDGNPVFRVVDPAGANLDFIQYVDGSQQMRVRGRFIGAARVSPRILHVGIWVNDRAISTPFYQDKLGFDQGRFIPHGEGQYVEQMVSGRDVETKNPPLDPTNPATRAQYEREQYGSVHHVCLEVSDIRTARDLVQKRGGFDDVRVRAHVGNSRRWLVHIFDPDGSRAELMESALQDVLPPMTVMPPGPPAPPMLPKTPGVMPWP